MFKFPQKQDLFCYGGWFRLEFFLEEFFLPLCDEPLTVSKAVPKSMGCSRSPRPDPRSLIPTFLGPTWYLAGP